jgi:hypothetical protein
VGLSVYPHNCARERSRGNEETLNTLYSKQFISYQKRIGYKFFSEFLLYISIPSTRIKIATRGRSVLFLCQLVLTMKSILSTKRHLSDEIRVNTS